MGLFVLESNCGLDQFTKIAFLGSEPGMESVNRWWFQAGNLHFKDKMVLWSYVFMMGLSYPGEMVFILKWSPVGSDIVNLSIATRDNQQYNYVWF